MKKYKFTYHKPNLVFDILRESYNFLIIKLIQILMDPKTDFTSIEDVLYVIVRLEISKVKDDGVLIYIRRSDIYLLMVGMEDHGLYQLMKIMEGPTELPFGESYGDLGGLSSVSVGLEAFKMAVQDLLKCLRERNEEVYTKSMIGFNKWKTPIITITVFLCEAARNYIVYEDVSEVDATRHLSPWSSCLILNWKAIAKSAFNYNPGEGDFLSDDEAELMYGKRVGSETFIDVLARLKACSKVCYFMTKLTWNFLAKIYFEVEIMKLLGANAKMSVDEIVNKLKPVHGCEVIPGQIETILWELTIEKKLEIHHGMYRRPRKNRGKEIPKEIATHVEIADHVKKPQTCFVFFGPAGSGKSTMSRQILHEIGKKYTSLSMEQTKIMFFETERKTFTMLDPPGCKIVMDEMTCCASQADIGVLVLSVEEFNKAEVQQLVCLARAMGIQSLLVLLNKMDLIKWSKERYDIIKKQTCRIIKSFSFDIKNDVNFVPVCGLHGLNLTNRLDKKTCEWFNSRSMLDVLHDHEVPLRYTDAPFRMPISYTLPSRVVYTGRVESGCYLLGKVVSGCVTKGSSVFIMPQKVEALVSAMLINGAEVRIAQARENLRVLVPLIEDREISPGFVLCDTYGPPTRVTEFIANLSVPKFFDRIENIRAGYRSILHIHSAAVNCKVLDVKVYEKNTKEITTGKLKVSNGEVARCRIQVDNGIFIERFNDIKELGCFALCTEQGKLVAVGIVTQLG